jgi:hypothetical protein
VKSLLPLVLVLAFALSACNTLTNRRSMYADQKVHGTYTRELEEGTVGKHQTVDQQYSESQAEKRYPKLVPGEKKPATPATGVTTPPTALPQ